jgi:hypothetical protein
MEGKDVIPGYVYHIKDSFFDLAQDDKLMKNREGDAYRPTYFCLRDSKTDLLWVVPMSSRVDKYKVYVDKDIVRYGRCLKIVIGNYSGKNNAFLLQNMFPILPKYIDHAHTLDGIPTPVDTRLQAVLNRHFREVLRLYRKGANIVFPDIARLEKLMLSELGS